MVRLKKARCEAGLVRMRSRIVEGIWVAKTMKARMRTVQPKPTEGKR